MPPRRASVSIRLEREVTAPDGAKERLALTAQIDAPAGGSAEPTPEELRAALAHLRSELNALVGDSATAPRSLDELVETYRPRQRELVDLLEAEGEISAPEANLLLAHLAQGVAGGAPRPAASDLPGPTDRPIAALPLEVDRSPSVPRPVARLLSEFRIETLKQAGAVRARRQISYEEYMALKRHFAVAAPAPPPTGTSNPAPAEGP